MRHDSRAAAAGRITARRNLELAKLHLIRLRRPQRLADALLLDQPADERAFAAVARAPRCLDSCPTVTKLVWIEQSAPLANSPMKMSPSSMFMRIMRLVARTMRSGMKLRIVPTTCVRSAPTNRCAEVDDRRAVAFERRHLEHRLVGVVIHLAQRVLRVEPLRVLLVAVEDERRADEAARRRAHACSASPGCSGR